ncbi:MAG: hypothetical protein IJF50_11460 [Peptococcaceae bacterium]|nr:hypothetical protein [Peptococcaceae bacterium]
MEKFICNHCSNHCQITYERSEKTLAEVNGYMCPNGMLSLLKELLPMNQKKEGTIK